MLKQYVIAFCVTALTHFVLAVIIYAKGRQRLTNITYALYSVAISWWSIFEAVAITRPDAQAALFWWRLNHVGVIFIPVFFVHFVISLLEPHQQTRRRYVTKGIYLFGLIALILNATPILIREVVPKFSFKYFINPGLVYHVFFALWVSLAIYGLIELFRVYATSARARRNQLTYFCWSMFVAYLGGIPNFLPTFNIEIPYLMPFGTYAIPLYALATAYAIVRYRLMDINLALTRGAIFVGVYACVISLPFLLALTRQGFLETLFGRQWWGIPLGLMALLATLGHYVNLFFQRKAEARLLREQRRYQAMLLNAAKGMTQIHDLQRLLKLLGYLLVRAMKLEHVGIFLWDDGREQHVLQVQVHPLSKATSPSVECGTHEPLVLWLMQERAPVVREEISQLDTKRGRTVSLSRLETQLKHLDAAVVVPSFVNDRLIGFLALGNKRTGTMYSEDDLSMLQTLANQAALAIENAQFYEKEKERQAELFHAASIADLGTMASSMSHQLNNPLCIISGTAQNREEYLRRALKQDAWSPDQIRQLLQAEIESLQSIQQEATDGSNIIATIRGITASTEVARPLLLAEAVNVALPIAQHKVPFNRLDFRRELPDILPRIWGDKAQLAQCVVSVLENAWDAIQARQEDRHLPAPPLGYKGLIRLAGSTVTEPNPQTKQLAPWVVLTISDNGIGLKPEDVRKLFIPFFTTKATAEKAFGSLFVVRRIIEAHGGTVSADSTYGVGTTFTVKLPALSDEDAARRMTAGRIAGNGPVRPK
jgi:signal transduction histidine kinase